MNAALSVLLVARLAVGASSPNSPEEPRHDSDRPMLLAVSVGAVVLSSAAAVTGWLARDGELGRAGGIVGGVLGGAALGAGVAALGTWLVDVLRGDRSFDAQFGELFAPLFGMLAGAGVGLLAGILGTLSAGTARGIFGLTAGSVGAVGGLVMFGFAIAS